MATCTIIDLPSALPATTTAFTSPAMVFMIRSFVDAPSWASGVKAATAPFSAAAGSCVSMARGALVLVFRTYRPDDVRAASASPGSSSETLNSSGLTASESMKTSVWSSYGSSGHSSLSHSARFSSAEFSSRDSSSLKRRSRCISSPRRCTSTSSSASLVVPLPAGPPRTFTSRLAPLPTLRNAASGPQGLQRAGPSMGTLI
mmetsp:Transcript_61371/g.161275  ORF Transcript_61371/g.161275 Transcript_61371/m.161275 type:complete len:202 (+) Transcript_61371:2253-2858(+)